jgi:hypothetical protein
MKVKALAFFASFSTLLLFITACGGSDGSRGLFLEDGPARSPGIDGSMPPDSPPDNVLDAEHKIVTNSTIRLDVQQVRAAFLDIGVIARSYGGFVAESRLSDEGSQSTATVRIRVPAARYEEAMAGLRGLTGAMVSSEETSAREVTAEYTDLQSQLLNLQRTEAQLQQLMIQARTVDEILNVSGRLQSVRGDIERLQGRINLVDNQSDFATISVVLTAIGPGTNNDLPSPMTVFVDAFEAMVVVAHVLANVAAALLAGAVLLLPAGIISLLSWRFARRSYLAVRARIS